MGLPSSERQHIAIANADIGKRLDRIVGERLHLGRNDSRRLFDNGHITVCDVRGQSRRARKGDDAAKGDVLEIVLPESRYDRKAIGDADAPLRVLFQDEHVVVVDKPAGQPTAPIRIGELGTVANALAARFPEMTHFGYDEREPGLCHRLDVGTSGVLLAARSENAFNRLTGAIRSGNIDKRYLLLCRADGLPDEGRIDHPVAPHVRSRSRMMVCNAADARRRRAQPALTTYRVRERKGSLALVEARVPAAKRHQIRVHFASIRHPLIGDTLYGGEAFEGLARHALHASGISWKGDDLISPFVVTASLPADLTRLLG